MAEAFKTVEYVNGSIRFTIQTYLNQERYVVQYNNTYMILDMDSVRELSEILEAFLEEVDDE